MPMQDSVEHDWEEDDSPRGNGVTHCIYCGKRFDLCKCDEAKDFEEKLKFERGER